MIHCSSSTSLSHVATSKEETMVGQTRYPGTKLTHVYIYIYNNNVLAHYFSQKIHLLSSFSHFFFSSSIPRVSSSTILQHLVLVTRRRDPVLLASVCVCVSLNARNQRRNVVETETGRGKRRRRGHFLIFRG